MLRRCFAQLACLAACAPGVRGEPPVGGEDRISVLQAPLSTAAAARIAPGPPVNSSYYRRKFSFVVQIRGMKTQGNLLRYNFCSGVITPKRTILTTVPCARFGDSGTSMFVRTSAGISSAKYRERHPRYDSRYYGFNVAVLRLDAIFETNRQIVFGAHHWGNKLVMQAGFGETEAGSGNYPDTPVVTGARVQVRCPRIWFGTRCFQPDDQQPGAADAGGPWFVEQATPSPHFVVEGLDVFRKERDVLVMNSLGDCPTRFWLEVSAPELVWENQTIANITDGTSP